MGPGVFLSARTHVIRLDLRGLQDVGGEMAVEAYIKVTRSQPMSFWRIHP